MKRLVFVFLLSVCAGGCATTVIPQKVPVDPVAVYVADYGVHSSLLLPLTDAQSDRQYVEYCFGDWGYAVENRCWPEDAMGALLLSNQSAFGRRYVDIAIGEEAPRPTSPPKRVMRIYASKLDVQRLERKLDERWERAAQTAVHNPDNDVDYVKDTEHYSFLHNCNDLTAKSLRELGCEIHGLVGTSDFKIVVRSHPKGAPAPELRSTTATASNSAPLQSAHTD